MSERKAREFWIVRSEIDTQGWVYGDLHGAEKRLGSGLKAPPIEMGYHIVKVREVMPDDELERLQTENERLKKENKKLSNENKGYFKSYREQKSLIQGLMSKDAMTKLELTRLKSAAQVLREVWSLVDCSCSIKERHSGRLVGCFIPETQEALAKFDAAMRGDK